MCRSRRTIRLCNSHCKLLLSAGCRYFWRQLRLLSCHRSLQLIACLLHCTGAGGTASATALASVACTCFPSPEWDADASNFLTCRFGRVYRVDPTQLLYQRSQLNRENRRALRLTRHQKPNGDDRERSSYRTARTKKNQIPLSSIHHQKPKLDDRE